MIELTEEPYDGPVGQELVQRLLEDVNVRYAGELTGLTQEQIDDGDAAYLAQVLAADCARPHGCFVVAWRDGGAVGCGAVKQLELPDGGGAPEGVGEIKRMYTAAQARRAGVGRQVLARLEAIAVELGYGCLVLETGTEQPEALAMYEREGWHAIEPYGHFKGSPASRCYAKDLVPS